MSVPERLLCRSRSPRSQPSKNGSESGGIYRIVVPTHRLKTRKQEGSSPRDFITNLVEKYLLQTKRVRTRQYLCSRSEAGAGVIPFSPSLFSSATFLPSTAKGSIRLGNTRPTLLLEAQPLDPTRLVQYRDMRTTAHTKSSLDCAAAGALLHARRFVPAHGSGPSETWPLFTHPTSRFSAVTHVLDGQELPVEGFILPCSWN